MPLFELRGQHIEALAAYHRIRIELERLAGTPLTTSQLAPRRPVQ